MEEIRSELFGRQIIGEFTPPKKGHLAFFGALDYEIDRASFQRGADDGKKCFVPIAGVPKTTKRTAYHPRPIAALISLNASGQYLAAIVRSS